MLAYQLQLSIDKNAKQPAYLQLANQLIQLIRTGELRAGQKLIGTRSLAELLDIHRKTVVQAYDELLVQGWLESKTGSGTYVAETLPEVEPQKLSKRTVEKVNPAKKAGFAFAEPQHLRRDVLTSSYALHLDDGFPDPRLAPLAELSRVYRSQLLLGNQYVKLGYGDTKGSAWLRQELSIYLNETRGLKITPENILITRGTVMGIHLASAGLVQRGDVVVTGKMSWGTATTNFVQAGAQIEPIEVDEYGLVIEELEKLCQRKTVRFVYVTSHHDYPTTVTLRADRRLNLLKLAEKYGFIIFEDDYDYDFHYLSKPLLPLASADRAGMVLYCGSFTKAISPAFRVGYLVGPEDVITHLARLRRIIDRQGDLMLENTVAELLQMGVIERHLRKSLKEYRKRRDVFAELLQNELREHIQFQLPDGGMAIWALFDKSIDIEQLTERCLKHDLFFSNGKHLHPTLNGTRLGFASSNEGELVRCVEVMKRNM